MSSTISFWGTDRVEAITNKVLTLFAGRHRQEPSGSVEGNRAR